MQSWNFQKTRYDSTSSDDYDPPLRKSIFDDEDNMNAKHNNVNIFQRTYSSSSDDFDKPIFKSIFDEYTTKAKNHQDDDFEVDEFNTIKILDQSKQKKIVEKKLETDDGKDANQPYSKNSVQVDSKNTINTSVQKQAQSIDDANVATSSVYTKVTQNSSLTFRPSNNEFKPIDTVKLPNFKSEPVNKIEPAETARLDSNSKWIMKENIELKTKLSQQNAALKVSVLKYEDKPDFKTTVDRILQDRPYWFDLYKNKKDKINLLAETVKSNDGNAILAAILFLKRTLIQDIFFEALVNNQTAYNQYVFYLRQINDQKQLYDLEEYQKNTVEAASIKHFKHILCDIGLDLHEKERIFTDFERRYSETDLRSIRSSQVYQAVRCELNLLKVQKELVKNKISFLKKDESKQKAIEFLPGSSVSYTVSFCLKYAKDLQENESYQVENLKKVFNLYAREFAVWYIKSMAEMSYWTELERFSQNKSLLSVVQKQTIPYMTIFYIILNAKGPNEQLKKYMSLIPDLDARKQLAVRLKIIEIVIDVYKQQKDRIGLINYRNQFDDGTKEYILCNIALKEQNKWKN